jgi:general secretion pathway protein N
MFRALNYHSGGQLTDPGGRTGRAWRIPYLRWYVLILLLAFAAFAVTTAPAWIAASLADQLSGGKVNLEQTSGTVWNGSAAAIVLPQLGGTGQRFENFSWEVLPGRLLGGEAVVSVKLNDPLLSAQALISSGLSHTTVSQLQAAVQAPLIATFVPVLDFWKPRGTVRISGDEMTLRPLGIRSPVTIDWQGAILSLSDVAPLGDYRLHAQPDREWINLDLQTIKGALLVSGTGQYSLAKGGEFQYRAKAGPGYTEQLEPLLDILGLREADESVTFKIPLAPLQ